MNLRHLKYFVAVADSGSVAAAARILNVSASPLSRRLRELEASVGLELFDRNKGFVLTAEGQRLLAIARRITGLTNEMFALARELNASNSTLSIGLRSIHPRLRKALLKHIHAARPDATLFVRPMIPEHQIAAIVEGTLDFATLRLPVADAGKAISYMPIFSEELGFAVPDRSPFSEKRVLSLTDLAGLRLIAHHTPYHPLLDSLFAGGMKPVAVDPHVAGAAAALISQGDHFMMLPLDNESPNRRAIDEPGVLFRRIAGRPNVFTTVLAWRSDRGMEEFTDILDVLKTAFSRPETV